MDDEEIEKASVLIIFCVALAFILGVYVGIKTVKVTDNEPPDSTNTTQELQIPIGKLPKSVKYRL